MDFIEQSKPTCPAACKAPGGLYRLLLEYLVREAKARRLGAYSHGIRQIGGRVHFFVVLDRRKGFDETEKIAQTMFARVADEACEGSNTKSAARERKDHKGFLRSLRSFAARLFGKRKEAA